jgi:hypothetical protein
MSIYINIYKIPGRPYFREFLIAVSMHYGWLPSDRCVRDRICIYMQIYTYTSDYNTNN